MNKPTLPREVADAVDRLQKTDTNINIIRFVASDAYSPDLELLSRYAFEGEHGGTPDLLMSALINGYNVEKSPEDKIREHYESIGVNYEKLIENLNDDIAAIVHERMRGIEFTLNTLGIKIEGVNA